MDDAKKSNDDGSVCLIVIASFFCFFYLCSVLSGIQDEVAQIRKLVQQTKAEKN